MTKNTFKLSTDSPPPASHERSSSLSAALKSVAKEPLTVAWLGEVGRNLTRLERIVGAKVTLLSGEDVDFKSLGARTPPAPDVIIINCAGGISEALSRAAEGLRSNPLAKALFVCDGEADPARHALTALGVQHVIPIQLAIAWCETGLFPLALHARATWLARSASNALPSIPSLTTAQPTEKIVPLAVAEQSFRDAYLRGLLTNAKSRREAAARSGVPYRTLCQMLAKLGIK